MTNQERDNRIDEVLKAIEAETKVKPRTPFRLALLSSTLEYLCRSDTILL